MDDPPTHERASHEPTTGEPVAEERRAVAGVVQRIELLEAERAILRRLHAYGHATDRADAEGFAGCFTSDGICAVEDPAGGPVERQVVGRAALLKLIEGFARPPGSRHRHLLIEPVIDVAPTLDRATSVSYFAVLREHGGAPCVWAFGRYLDELVREPDGEWRFTRRRAALDSVDASQPPLAEGSVSVAPPSEHPTS